MQWVTAISDRVERVSQLSARKAGWLHKRGGTHGTKNAHARFFVLTLNTLTYYEKDPGEAKLDVKPCGVIQIRDVQKVVNLESGDYPDFQLVLRSRTYFLVQSPLSSNRYYA